MTARTVAAKMAISSRAYYSFESGEGALDFAKIWRFADATDCDPFGVILALILGSPDIALRSMDNKGASIMLAFYRELDVKLQDRSVHIGSAAFIEGFRRLTDSLQDYLAKRDQGTERWLAENLPNLLDED